ncbi:hypothetical protein ABS71_17670 [bacterium SCN 62-11]|nr:polysaccharide deacetylase family protein [Candidatus Eremiobacteraeota bacterium]ODT59799.1 MAG: hypothetical protein ABS71_17670 [bacterium SCN 62-11]
MKKHLVTLALLVTGTWGAGSAPIADASMPGAVQPLAPGQRKASALPTLDWSGRPPEIERVEFASNGNIEVAHALVLVTGEADPDRWLYLVRQSVDGAFGERASLHEVDVSVYRAETYQGFGGPAPVMTASVPKARLHEFARKGLQFERLWVQRAHLALESSPPELAGREQGLKSTEASENLFYHGSEQRWEAALTFDDSPHPLYEPLLLDTLSRSKVHATFFCIGRNARVYPHFISDMTRQGHEVANHTYHHVRLPALGNSAVAREIELANSILEGLTEQKCRLFRPPGGEYSKQTLKVAEELGMTTVFWTDDPCDFDNPGEAVIEDRLVEHLRPGGIVLLHDNVEETIEILPRFVRVADRKGYQLMTAGELASRQNQ